MGGDPRPLGWSGPMDRGWVMKRSASAVLVLLLSSCGPSLVQLREVFPAWTRAADASCTTPGRCPEASACLAAIAAVAAPAAGRREVAAAYSACRSFAAAGGRP